MPDDAIAGEVVGGHDDHGLLLSRVKRENQFYKQNRRSRGRADLNPEL
jgi:hypothetical protein